MAKTGKLEYVSKLEALRRGHSVEIEPGVHARLNPKTKSLEHSTGEVEYVGNNLSYFPKDEGERKIALEKESLQRKLTDYPLGRKAGEFLHETGTKAAIGGGPLDVIERITNKGDDYLAKKAARSMVSKQISEDSPGIAIASSIAALVPDLAVTKGMSALKAAPLLTAIGSGSEVIDDPLAVMGKVGGAAAAGWLIDKGGQVASKMAARRGLSREVAAKTIKAEREMQQAKTAFSEAKVADTAKKASLKQDYLTKKAAYEKDLASLDPRRRAAQKKFSASVNKELDDLEKIFPKGTRIKTKDLDVWNYYHDYIQKNGLVGTKEARNMETLIKELFPQATKKLKTPFAKTPKQFVDSLRGIEGAAVTANEVERQFLGQLKEHLGEKTAQLVNDSVLAYEFRFNISKSLKSDLRESLTGVKNAKPLIGGGEARVKEYLNTLSPSDLAQKIKEPGFAQELAEKAISKNKFSAGGRILTKSEKEFFRTHPLVKPTNPTINRDQFVKELTAKIENNIAASEAQMAETATQASGDVAENLRRTYGMSEPIEAPPQPEAPVYDAPPTMQEVAPAPELPPAEGMAERMGDVLEKPMGNILKGKGPMGTGTAGKLLALKYLATPKTAVAAGAYAGLKGLTSPTAGGAVARATFRDMGIGVVDYLAQRYPSYNEGTLDDPMERRSLVKEIENDESMPLNTQALTQSQVNRGKSIKTEGLDR